MFLFHMLPVLNRHVAIYDIWASHVTHVTHHSHVDSTIDYGSHGPIRIITEGHCCLWIWKWFFICFQKVLSILGLLCFFAKTSDLLSTCFARSWIWDCFLPLISFNHPNPWIFYHIVYYMYMICIVLNYMENQVKVIWHQLKSLLSKTIPTTFHQLFLLYEFFGGPTLIKIQHYIYVCIIYSTYR